MNEWIEEFKSNNRTFYIYHWEQGYMENTILKPIPIVEYLDSDFNKLCGISTEDDVEKKVAACEARGKKVKTGPFAFKGLENYKDSEYKIGIWEILPKEEKAKYKKLLASQNVGDGFDSKLEILTKSEIKKSAPMKKIYKMN